MDKGTGHYIKTLDHNIPNDSASLVQQRKMLETFGTLIYHGLLFCPSWQTTNVNSKTLIYFVCVSRFSLGDTEVPFCLQSTSKPLNYALAISDMGSNRVHSYVGQEPSGRSFNELTLDHNSEYWISIFCYWNFTLVCIRDLAEK